MNVIVAVTTPLWPFLFSALAAAGLGALIVRKAKLLAREAVLKPIPIRRNRSARQRRA
jgi:hypothetical protein